MSNPTIRAIETEFNGYKFRSRLEARWAVFFSELGIRYEYEPEGFEMDGVRYLPDFWLPDFKLWCEVKPESPNEEEIRKAVLLWGRGDGVAFLIGTPVVPSIYNRPMGHSEVRDASFGLVSAWVWAESASGEIVRGSLSDQSLYFDSPRLVRAYRAARQARFEFLPKNMRRIVEDKQGADRKRAQPTPETCRREHIPGGAFSPGDRVNHHFFGDGLILASSGPGDDEIVRVIFPGVGEKSLIVTYARLTKLSGVGA